MNADQRRWKWLATVAPLLGFGEIHCLGADITPPSERQPAKGVAEYADEFADADKARKPLIEWMLPFTQYVATPFLPPRLAGAMPLPKPKVHLEAEHNLNGMEPTQVELLIERGFPLGDWNSSNQLAEAISLPFTR